MTCAGAGFALAQDNAIRIKNPDGTETVVEIPGAGTVGTAAPARPEKPRAPAAPIVKTYDAPSILKRVEREKPDSPAARDSAVAAPAVKPVLAPEIPKKKPVLAPAPLKKESAGKVVGTPQIPKPETQTGYVTEKAAQRIALKIAPPARGMQVFPREYEGRPAHLVRFRTEGGFFDVLVDMETGDILATKDM